MSWIVFNSRSLFLSTSVLFSKRLYAKLVISKILTVIQNILMVILTGRGYPVRTVRWRGYVVTKVGIELLGQLKIKITQRTLREDPENARRTLREHWESTQKTPREHWESTKRRLRKYSGIFTCDTWPRAEGVTFVRSKTLFPGTSTCVFTWDLDWGNQGAWCCE